MDYVEELPWQRLETTAGEVRECTARFALKLRARTTVGRKEELGDHGPSRILGAKSFEKQSVNVAPDKHTPHT